MQAFLAPVEFMSTPEYRQLERAGHAGRWWRLVELAKRAGYKGCVVRSYGAIKALDSNWLASYAEGDVQAWTEFLAMAEDLDLIKVDTETKSFQIIDWTSFHKPPAHTPEGERVRKEEQRAKASSKELSHSVPPPLGQLGTNNVSQVSQNVPRVPIDRIGSDQIRSSSSSGGGLEEGQEEETPSAISSDASRRPVGGDDAGGSPPAPPTNGAAISLSTWWVARFCSLRPSLKTLDYREKKPIAQKIAEAIHAGATEDTVRAAVDATLTQTDHEQRSNGAKDNPVRYAESLLGQHLENSLSQQRLNAARLAQGLPTSAYRWKPDDP